jgi:hypothetical protein
MREIIENFEGTDAELLAALNAKDKKRVIGEGLVTLLMVAAIDQDLAAKLNFTLEQTIAGMRQATDQATQAQASFLDRILKRLSESSNGADFANDQFRATATALLLQAGWTQTEIDTVLNLGAVYESTADQTLGRDATQTDIDDVRRGIYNETQQARATNAAALFASRVEQAETAWTDQEAIDQWALAWGDSA